MAGFYGRISGTGERVPGASKGVVLNARILWTFSSAYRLLHKDEYLKMATRAKQELITHFYDHEYGGYFGQFVKTVLLWILKNKFMH